MPSIACAPAPPGYFGAGPDRPTRRRTLAICLTIAIGPQLTPNMTASDTSLLERLQALEVELHKPAARSSLSRLDALLHDDFREHGRSGSVYSKADILARLPAVAEHAVVVADQFELHPIRESAALLTYRSAHQLADGTLERFTLRVSVWERAKHGWQMRFHQGTPTAQFAS